MVTPSESPAATKGAPREKEQQGGKNEPPRSAAAAETEQLIFTLRPATGEVVKIEKIDAAGKRSEVPQDEAVALAGKQNLDEIEAAIDEAFEAGISSVLDPGNDDEEPEETAEEMEVRRLLLRLIINQAVRRRVRRRIVQRLIVSRTLSR